MNAQTIAPSAAHAAPLETETVLSFALVNNAKNTATTPQPLPWGDWCARLTCFAIRADKDGPGFIPAVLNGPRKAENLEHYTALVLDIEAQGDATPPPPEEAAQRLQAAGLAGVVYTSHNHMAPPELNNGKPAAPRYRVVVPLAQPMQPTVPHLQTNMQALAARLALLACTDTGSKDRSRLFYLPSHREGAPHFAQAVPGDWWQPLAPMETAQPPRPTAAPVGSSTAAAVDAGTLGRVKAALPLWDPDDYHEWVKVGMALHSSNHPDAYALWCAWGAKSPKYSAHDHAAKWASFNGNRLDGVTVGSIIAGPTPSAWQEPESYAPAPVAAPPYPIDALPPLARDAARAIAYHVDAPLALAAQCVLGTLVYLAQRAVNAPDISHSQDGMPASLFLLTEGDSGERKTRCQTLADWVTQKYERERMEEYMQELREYNALSRKDREGLPAPICPKTLYSDATIEPVISAFINGATDAMLSSDEAGQFFGGHTMKSDTARAAMGSLTKLWSSGIAERTRSAGNAGGSGVAYDCRLSINLLGQRAVIGESLRDPVLRGQGLLPRFIFAAPDSLAGKRFHRPTHDDNPYRDPRLHRYWDRCRMLLGVSEDGLPPDLSSQPEADQLAAEAMGRRVLPMHPEAEKLAAALYVETELAQGKGGKFEFLRPFAARAEENARRVATVLAYFEGLPTITPDIMQAACQIIRYSLNEWMRYSDSAESDPDTARLQHLERWLIEQAKATGAAIPRSRILTHAPSRHHRKAKALDEALETLTAAHRVRTVRQDGRTAIMVNPALLAAPPC